MANVTILWLIYRLRALLRKLFAPAALKVQPVRVQLRLTDRR